MSVYERNKPHWNSAARFTAFLGPLACRRGRATSESLRAAPSSANTLLASTSCPHSRAAILVASLLMQCYLARAHCISRHCLASCAVSFVGSVQALLCKNVLYPGRQLPPRLSLLRPRLQVESTHEFHSIIVRRYRQLSGNIVM